MGGSGLIFISLPAGCLFHPNNSRSIRPTVSSGFYAKQTFSFVKHFLFDQVMFKIFVFGCSSELNLLLSLLFARR
jgi:hypothetical protein